MKSLITVLIALVFVLVGGFWLTHRSSIFADATASAQAAGEPADGRGKVTEKTAADDKSADGKPAGAETGPSAYPVVLTAPVLRKVTDAVEAFGYIRADARSARSVAVATQGVVEAVAVVSGERVRKGQELLKVAADPAAHLAYSQAKSAAAVAQRDVVRLRRALADGLATAAAVDAAEKTLSDAQAALEAARQQGASPGSDVLRSPIDGIVTQLTAQIGDRPAAGATLVTLMPVGDVQIVLGVEPADAARIRTGAVVHVQAVQSPAVERTGRVRSVASAVDPDTHLVTVVASLDALASAPVLAGAAVRASIEATVLNAYSLPRTALVRDDKGTVVFEAVDGHAHRVAVTVIVDQGSRVAVTGDLAVSRPVVTTGAYEVEDGVALEGSAP